MKTNLIQIILGILAVAAYGMVSELEYQEIIQDDHACVAFSAGMPLPVVGIGAPNTGDCHYE